MDDPLRALAIADIKAWARARGIPMDDERAGRVLDNLIEIETEQVINGCGGATDVPHDVEPACGKSPRCGG